MICICICIDILGLCLSITPGWLILIVCAAILAIMTIQQLARMFVLFALFDSTSHVPYM